MDSLRPRDVKDVEQSVRDALAADQTLEIVGQGTKRAIGQPAAANAVLELAALNAVKGYEPSELILTVESGAPLADIESLIDAKNQEFAFEPMDPAALLGTSGGRGTVGGMIAAGLAGPRRVRSGGVRDHLLGAKAVSGFGEAFAAGGKVVKNVTGYDLCKLLAGSWGTLAVMTEVTLKVMPKAETESTLVLSGLDDITANRAMTAALGSPFDVSGAAHIPASALRDDGVGLDGVGAAGQALTLIRLEGIGVSVADRARSLAAALAGFGRAEIVSGEAQSRGLWLAIRDVTPFAAAGPVGAWPVWRVVCPPASGGHFGDAFARETGGDLIYDWGGGLIWAALPPTADGCAVRLRDRLKAIGGHAVLIRGGEDLRAAIDVFQPLEPGVAALSRRVKASFDPKDIFNRNRMARGTGA